ncbi:MAG: DUF4118 domain-containing protein, partial [Acidimicrobiales bacterium]
DFAQGLGFFVAGLGPLAVAGVLVPFREDPFSTGVVLVLMLSVIAAAAILAGLVGGATATVIAALSFNYFFTRPYLVLEIDSSDDLRPVILLLIVGLGTAALAGKRRASRGIEERAPQYRPNESRHIQRVVGLIMQGADGRDVTAAVQAELTALLLLRSCRFEAGDTPARLPRLERNGTVSGRDLVPGHRGLTLPEGALELPVQAGGRTFGRFVLDPTPNAWVPFEHRVVAVILTDHLAAAIASHMPSVPR